MPDKYDEAVAYLTEHPHKIPAAWATGGAYRWFRDDTSPGAALFQYAATDADLRTDGEYGCLTMILGGDEVAHSPALTEAIRADTRIPASSDDIRVEHLPVFAEWQRRLDKELNRQ